MRDDHSQDADTSQPPPATIRYSNNYGDYLLGSLQWGEYNGYPTLEGVVLEGSTTSRLGAHSISRSAVGEHMTVYGVTKRNIELGSASRYTCG